MHGAKPVLAGLVTLPLGVAGVPLAGLLGLAPMQWLRNSGIPGAAALLTVPTPVENVAEAAVAAMTGGMASGAHIVESPELCMEFNPLRIRGVGTQNRRREPEGPSSQ